MTLPINLNREIIISQRVLPVHFLDIGERRMERNR
jgi:hypothetical protein